MDYIETDEMLVTEAVKMVTIPELKMVRKQVILEQGTPVGRGNMCFLYSKSFDESVKMMTNKENFLSKNHYLLYFYPTNYNGRIYNKKFRFREIDKRKNYCDIVNKKVKAVSGYDRAVINMSEKRNIFIDLHRYLEIFESICTNLTASQYIIHYWRFFKSIIDSYSIYSGTYPTRYMIVDLKNFTMTKSLTENLRNPLYIIFYTLYKNYKILSDIDIDIYFYNGNKVLLINPSHSDEDTYKQFRIEMRKVTQGLSKNVTDKTDEFTKDEEIKKAEAVEEPAQSIISKVYDNKTINDASELLSKSPVNLVAPSPLVSKDIDAKVAKAANEVRVTLNKDIAKIKAVSEEPSKEEKPSNISKEEPNPKENVSDNKKVEDNIENVVNDAVTKKAEEDIDNDKELIDKIYKDLTKNTPTQTSMSKRDELLRKAQYDIKIGNTTIKDLDKIKAKDITIENHDVSSKVSGINKNMTNITFNQFEKTYNEKLMKKDIVNAILALNDKSLPLYIVSIDIKDSSDVLNYKDTYKIVMEDSQRKRHTVTVDIPKFVEDKFLYINGNKMMIKHQSFFYPVVKVSNDTVHITTNYNKVIITRNDRKGVSAVERFKKIVKNNEEVNKRCTFGNVSASNIGHITTIEYDDLSKMIAEFKSGKTTIYFNQEAAKEIAAKKEVKLSDEFMFIGFEGIDPVYINVNTGKDSRDRSVVDVIMESLPDNIQNEFLSTRHPKVLTFAQCRIMEKTVKCGVLLAFWCGFSELIKKLKVEYRLENKTPRELASNEDYIIFNDCVFIYKVNTVSSLILTGLSDLDTSNINIADMDIRETYSPYILKRFGNTYIENALMNFYEFLIDPITKEILDDMSMPTDVVDLFIYAINLLGDSQYIPEINQGLSRIRSNEIVAAILYERLAKNYVLYRNSNGRKKFSVPQNAVMQEVQSQNTVENYSTLNPFLELQMSHYVSSKGFRGSNMDRAYKTEKRSYDKSMTGTISAITSPDGNVGINKQLTLEPRIVNARGYVNVPKDNKDIDNCKDVNIFSPVELTMPNVSMVDDSTRLGFVIKHG